MSIARELRQIANRVETAEAAYKDKDGETAVRDLQEALPPGTAFTVYRQIMVGYGDGTRHNAHVIVCHPRFDGGAEQFEAADGSLAEAVELVRQEFAKSGEPKPVVKDGQLFVGSPRTMAEWSDTPV